MKGRSKLAGQPVYVVDGNRTPFLKVKDIGSFSASDLAVSAGMPLLMRQPILPKMIDEVILGAAMPGPDEANIARLVALRLGCGDHVPAFTVMRNCASGLQALDDAAMQIAMGRRHLVLAGGTEAMSRAPLLWNDAMTRWLSRWTMSKTWSQRAQLCVALRPSFLAPVVTLLRGLTDPLIGLNMGQTAEKIAYLYDISREMMDTFACESHHKALRAWTDGRMTEVTPIIDTKGRVYERDDGIRADSTLEKLSTLKPFFDKKYGMVTAGNSSQITDGACLLLLASEEAVNRYQLPVMGQIIDIEWAGLDPAQMGLGPVHASIPLLQRHGLGSDDIDCWEINEAFAAQTLGCLRVMEDPQYCQTMFNLDEPFGAPDEARVNPDGGAIALGHPIGASGARVALHTLTSLQQTQGRRGIATLCIGGGQGGAMYLERV